MRRLTVVLLLSVAGLAALGAQAQQSESAIRRDAWQRTSDVLAYLGATEGAVVADVGAGTGYFTEKLSRAVGPTGHVYAVDVAPAMLQKLRDLVLREDLRNVDVVTGSATSTGLRAQSLDAVLVMDAYHEMTDHAAMLASMRESLKSSGRLVMMERIAPRESDRPREQQTRNHHLDMSLAVVELRAAGFTIVERIPSFITDKALGAETYWLVVARPGLRRDIL